MAKTTTFKLLSHPYQIAAEVTEGTPPSNATFTAIPIKSLGIKKDSEYVDVSQLGPEDLIALIQGLKKYETQIKFLLDNSTFLKRLINAANYGTPAGTISESFTAVIGIYLNGQVNYIIFKGSRPKDGNLKLALGKEHEVTMNLVHTDITVPNTAHGLTSPTLTQTFPSGPVWSWTSGGPDPVSLGGSALDCTEFNLSINRNTKVDHTLGNLKPHSSQPHGRRIGGDFTCLWTGTALETAYENGTAQTLAVVLKTSVSTLTISNAVIKTYSRDGDSDSDETAVEKAGYGAPTIQVT